jgi:hypothetical protein
MDRDTRSKAIESIAYLARRVSELQFEDKITVLEHHHFMNHIFSLKDIILKEKIDA